MLFSCFPKSICAELHAGIQITDHITMITLLLCWEKSHIDRDYLHSEENGRTMEMSKEEMKWKKEVP